jgi:membrane fusion protein (multidrug efflux system)
MKRNYIFFSWLFLSLLILEACGNKDSKKPPAATANRQTPGRVDGFIVKTKSVSENVEVPGTLVANEATEIHPEVSGRIIQLNVAEGRMVSKGALLARLYDGDLQAQLNKLRVQLQIAETNEQRSEQLLKIQGISKSDYDASLLNVNNIKADMEITRANLSKTVIRAPFTGRVGLRNISPGAYVTPASVLATIQQTNILKLDFSVPEKYSSNLKVGQMVDFSTEATQKRYRAKITAMESSVTLDTRSLMIRSVIENKDNDLVPGSFAKVMLRFDPDPNAIVIPTQAVIPQARGKKVILYKGGTAVFTDVTTGVRDSATVQITAGLKPGDTVLVTGLMSTRPEGKIIINKIVNSN